MAQTKTNTRKATTRKATAKAAPAPKATDNATDALPKGLRAPTGANVQLPMAGTVEVLFMDNGTPANPKRPGSNAHARFGTYLAMQAAKGANGYTVADLLKAGVQPSDLRYNLRHGYIAVAGVTVDGRNIVVAD